MKHIVYKNRFMKEYRWRIFCPDYWANTGQSMGFSSHTEAMSAVRKVCCYES